MPLLSSRVPLLARPAVAPENQAAIALPSSQIYASMNPIKFLRITTRLLALVLVTFVYLIGYEAALLLRGKKKQIDVINIWVPRWARANMWFFGVKVSPHRSRGDDNEIYPACGSNGVGRIFVMNHRSGLDIPVILTIAEAHVISRHDIATWPLLGRSARRVGTLFVDRESRRSGASVLKEVAKVLAKGEGVAMFPEGTAHEGDVVREFRTGAFNAARRAGAEIVPLGVAYSDEAAYYRKESFLSHTKRIATLPRLEVAIEIGTPLRFEDRTPVEMKNLAQEQVQALVNQARARLDS